MAIWCCNARTDLYLRAASIIEMLMSMIRHKLLHDCYVSFRDFRFHYSKNSTHNLCVR